MTARAGQQVPSQGDDSADSHYNDGKSGVESQQINKQTNRCYNKQPSRHTARQTCLKGQTLIERSLRTRVLDWSWSRWRLRSLKCNCVRGSGQRNCAIKTSYVSVSSLEIHFALCKCIKKYHRRKQKKNTRRWRK